MTKPQDPDWILLGTTRDEREREREREAHLGFREQMVIVQEDQAGEPWSSTCATYTNTRSFKAPPES